jgi:hypothetical protein
MESVPILQGFEGSSVVSLQSIHATELHFKLK